MSKIGIHSNKNTSLIPSDKDILSVATHLGIDSESRSDYIHESRELIKKLSALKSENPAKYIAVAGRTGENIDLAILSGLFGEDFNFSKLCNKGYISEDNTSEYFCISQNWNSYSRAVQKRFLGHFTRLDTNSLDIKTQCGIGLIILAEFKSKSELSRGLQMKFSEVSKFLIIYPLYILSLSKKDQNIFFKLWFQSQDEIGVTANTEIGIYILKYFGDVEFIQEKLGPGKNIEVEQIMKQTRVAAQKGINNTKEENTLPNQEELEMIYDIYGFTTQRNARNQYTNFLKSISNINSSNTVGQPIKRLILSGNYKPELRFNPGDSSGTLDTILQKKDLYALEQFTQKINFSANNRRKIKKYLLSNLREFSYEDLAIVGLIAAKIVSISPSEENELINVVKKASIFIIAYPKYISAMPESQQNGFFSIFLSSFKDETTLSKLESPFLDYIIEKFSHIKTVREFYKKLIDSKQEDLETQNNRFTSIWESDYKNSVEEYNSIGQIESLSITIQKGNTLRISNFPELSEGKNIHLVVYNKSKNNNNLIAPQFYIISEDNSELEILKGSGKYSFVAFTDKKKTPYKSLKELPKEVDSMNTQRVYLDGEEGLTTAKIAPQQRKELKRSSIGKAVANPTTPVVDKEIKNAPDTESLQVGIAMIFDELSYTLDEKGIITFTVPEGIGVVGESGYMNKVSSRKIIFDIGTIPASLISFLGIEDFQISDGDLEDIVKQRIEPIEKEYLHNISNENKRKAAKIIQELPNLEEKYETATKFGKSCRNSDLYDIKNGEIYYLWQLPFGKSLEEEIILDMEKCGFTIEFSKDNVIATQIKITTLKNTNVSATFDLSSGVEPGELDIINGSYNAVQLGVLRHILIQVLSMIVYKKYKLTSRSKQRKKIEAREEIRKEMRESVANKVKQGTASLVDRWDIIDKNNVGKDHIDLLTYGILGKVPHIRVRKEIKDHEKNELEFSDLKKKIEDGKIDNIVDSFYLRILSTCGIISGGKSVLTSPGAEEALKSSVTEIKVVTTIQEKRELVIRSLEALYDKDFSVQLIKPIDFSYNELVDLINK